MTKRFGVGPGGRLERHQLRQSMMAQLKIKELIGVVLLLAVGSILISCKRSRPADPSSATQTSPKSADLVLISGKVITMDKNRPRAQAVAVRGDVIVAVGTDEEIKPFVSRATRVIDLKGKLALPGFIEAHAHFLGLGQSAMQLRLGPAKTFQEIVDMVRAATRGARPGQWILGRGWHQEKWTRAPKPAINGLPTHHALSAASPRNPVLLRHASGHSSLVNRKAMELAKVTRKTPDPPGGEIVRDGRGNPTGVFRENAQALLMAAFTRGQAKRTKAEVVAELGKAADLATKECWSKGITSFHDAGASFEEIDFYRKRVREGKLGVRLWVMISERNEQLAERLGQYRIINLGDRRLTVRAIKRYVDGALGAHGAWLLKPYSDLPRSTGLNATPLKKLQETARLAIRHGFQMCTHAIGDRGNREMLNLYETVFKNHPDKMNLRWRIEHAQHLHPDDIPRFARLGVIAAMQSIHCTSDGPWVVKRLGTKRARQGAYAWKKLMQSGAVVANGSDAPVEDVDPIKGFYAAVTRRLKDGSVFFAEQRMTRMEALRSYTLNAAYAAFEENIKGSLEPGKLADIVVLSRDILTVPEEEILKARVVYTIIGGKVVYRK